MRWVWFGMWLAYACLFVLSLFLDSVLIGVVGILGMGLFAYKWLETFEDDAY